MTKQSAFGTAICICGSNDNNFVESVYTIIYNCCCTRTANQFEYYIPRYYFFILFYPLSLNTIFRQTENSVVQITSKTPTTSNSSSQSSSNVNTLGSGFVYDKQGHIVTNVHVVGGVCNISRWQ